MSGAIVIVGSGLAGITVARELRKLNRELPLVVVTADDGAFYSKPSLSNAFGVGKTPTQLVLTPAEKLAEQLNTRFVTNAQVLSIDTAGHVLETTQGKIEYTALVLATGAQPIRLPLAGSGAEDVLSVNNLADYTAFRNKLQAGQHVAILGGGLIGCEFANDLQPAGYSVSVFDLAPHPLGRLLPPKASAYFHEKLAAAGIAFHSEQSINSVEKTASGYVLRSSTGHEFTADIVLSAIGLKPAVELAQAAGLAVQRGIVVDQFLQTSAPDVYALGDCAEVCNLVLPYVLPIMSAARALAKTLAGEKTALTYPAMPVMVKTPACPTVVSPPAAGAVGEWQEAVTAEGMRSLFVGTDGATLGCALLGEAAKERQAIAAQLPAVL